MKNEIAGEKRKGYLLGKISYGGICYEITQDYDEQYNPFSLYKVAPGRIPTSYGAYYCDIREKLESYANMASVMAHLTDIMNEVK